MMNNPLPVIFTLQPHSLFDSLVEKLPAAKGTINRRNFPDGESYLRIETDVKNKPCIVLADLSHPDEKYLPLIFLLSTLRELGASSVGLIAPYLSYMRQDRRFIEGEAITSRIFAQDLSKHIDWLVTIDPHLHRYHALGEIYSIPTRVVQGAPLLAQWLKNKKNIFLVGPDAESEQWVSRIAQQSGHSFIIGNKQRKGDREVLVELPDLSRFRDQEAIIIDDVISSGQTILKCIDALKENHIKEISCAAVHGIFADHADEQLLQQGLKQLVVSNSIDNSSNTGRLHALDITDLMLLPIRELLTRPASAKK